MLRISVLVHPRGMASSLAITLDALETANRVSEAGDGSRRSRCGP